MRGWKKFLSGTRHIMLKFVHFDVHIRMIEIALLFIVDCSTLYSSSAVI